MTKFAPALLAAAFAPLVAAAATSGTFEVGQRGHMLVPVSVNGAEARPFALDTAASVTVLGRKEYPDLVSAGTPMTAHGGHGRTAHGSIAAELVRLESVSLWGERQQDSIASLMTLEELTPGRVPDFAGVLGLPFLRRYRLDLDYPARRLTLDEQDGELPACEICDPQAAITLGSLVGGLPSVEVTVNGQRMTALFDTGASRTILNERAIAALGLADAGSGEAIGKVSIALGTLPARDHTVARIDLPVFKTLRLDVEPALILGIDFLGAGRTVVDLEAGLAWFRPATN